MASIQHLLGRHGLKATEDDIAAAMDEALQEGGFQHPYPDPRAHLSSEEQELLSQGGFHLDRRVFGLEDPLVRTAFEYAVLRATALTTRQAAERLSVNDSRVRQRLSEGTLYGVKVGDEWRLPAFQFLEKEPVPGIERVLPRLPERLSLVAVHRWFHTPNPDLQLPEPARPLSPMEWLRAGQDPEPVAELAAGL